MFKKYRELQNTTKLLGLVLILGIVLAFTVTNAPSLAITSVLVTAGILVSIHLMIQYPRFIKFSIIFIVQLMLVAYVSLLYGGFFGLQYGLYPDLAIITSAASLIALSLVIIYLALAKAKGRMVTNLIVGFFLLDFSGFILGSLFGLGYLPSLGISALLSLGFIVLRIIPFGMKNSHSIESEEVRKEVFKNSLVTSKIESIIRKNKWNFKTVPNYDNFWIVNTGKNIIVMSGIAFQENVKKTKTGYIYKGIPVENLIGDLAEIAANLSQEYKIPRNKIHFVIIDVNNRVGLPVKGYQRYELVLKHEKTNVKTRMVLASSYGISVWSERVSEDNISQPWDNFVNRLENPSTKKKKNKIDKKNIKPEIDISLKD